MPIFRPSNPPPGPVIVDEMFTISREQFNWIEKYIDVPSWICPSCGSTVFGRTKICPYNYMKQYCRTSRPSHYIESVIE